MRKYLKRTPLLSGQVAVMFALSLVVLLGFLGFAVDLGLAWGARTDMDGVLESAKQSAMAQSNAVKFAERTGDEARAEVIEALSQNEFTGTAEIWYAELPQSETGPADRWGGVHVSCARDQATPFLAMLGTPEIGVETSICWTYHPYSTARVWRPADTAGGWERVVMERGAVVSSTKGSGTVESAPQALRDAIGAARDEAA